MEKRNKIKDVLQKLNDIASDYAIFELALVLFLRADVDILDNDVFDANISDAKINELEKALSSYNSIFDIEKEDVDNIIFGGAEDYDE